MEVISGVRAARGDRPISQISIGDRGRFAKLVQSVNAVKITVR